MRRKREFKGKLESGVVWRRSKVDVLKLAYLGTWEVWDAHKYISEHHSKASAIEAATAIAVGKRLSQ